MDCVRNYLTSKEPCVHASQSCRDASFIVESTTDCVGDRAQIPDRNRAESWHEQHDRDEGVAKGNSDERAAAADPQVPTVRSSLCASRSSRTASVGDSRREEEEGCVASLGSRTLHSPYIPATRSNDASCSVGTSAEACGGGRDSLLTWALRPGSPERPTRSSLLLGRLRLAWPGLPRLRLFLRLISHKVTSPR